MKSTFDKISDDTSFKLVGVLAPLTLAEVEIKGKFTLFKSGVIWLFLTILIAIDPS